MQGMSQLPRSHYKISIGITEAYRKLDAFSRKALKAEELESNVARWLEDSRICTFVGIRHWLCVLFHPLAFIWGWIRI